MLNLIAKTIGGLWISRPEIIQCPENYRFGHCDGE
jgi:hypothetical protein